jgi:hypothetical protein
MEKVVNRFEGSQPMKCRWSLLMLVLLQVQATAQEPSSGLTGPATSVWASGDGAGCSQSPCACDDSAVNRNGLLTGNHNFPNFIGFLSNPLESIDPRAMTAVCPLFLSAWTSGRAPVPDADSQVYGPLLTLALSDRFAIGLNQGGYAAIHLSRNERDRLFRLDPLGQFRDVEVGGSRTGFLNIGGFAQYTLIEDVPAQFLLTGGLRWEVPAGSYEVFQGHGPVHLAPYLTAGKEFGEFHVLATTGYQFPAGPGNDTTDLFYANFHFDRRLFGWLYPVVEFNCIYHTTSVSFGLPTRRGFFDLNNFESSGNLVTLSGGVNAVLIPEKLELGAVYTTSIATEHDFQVNGLLVKLELRY